MQTYQPSDNDPFILTEKSLALSDGTSLTKKVRSKFGKLIPFQLWGYRLNIGPDYMFFFFAFTTLSFLGGLLVCAQIHFQANAYFVLTSVCINLVQAISYLLIFVSNPGIAMESIDPQTKSGGKFCRECEIFVSNSTNHCQDCKVCILQYDHHCPWTSKCIGKNNLKRFYVFVVSIFICLLYNIVVLPISLAPDPKPISIQ